LNELSAKFECNETSSLIGTNDDIGIISDSLQASTNGKSADWCHVNETVNEVSAKPDENKKSSHS
jgi:hypothetical protein